MSLPDLPQVPRERRGTATVMAVGVLGLLCLLALVFGVKGLMAPADPQPAVALGRPSASPSIATTGPRPAPAASTTSTPTTPSDQVAFSSPSGNIRCVVSSAGARCDIGSRSWRPPARPASCRDAWGKGLSVDARRAGLSCAADPVPSGPGLAYGRRVARGAFTCLSTSDGIRCTGSTGHGFMLSRARYALR